jgi:2'-phosphotransferase
VTGLRKSAQILIFIDIPKALDAGIKFFLSDNGVVLTEGDASGILKSEFFSRVENRRRAPLPGWEGSGPIDSKAVEAPVSTGGEAGPSSSAVSGAEKALEGLSVASEPESK